MAKKPKEIASLLLSSIGLKTGYYNGAQFDQEDLYCFVEKDAFEGLLEDLFKDTDEEKKIKQAFMMSYIHDFGFNFFRQSKDKLQDISFIANNIARSEVITEGYLLDLVLNTWLLFFDQNAKIVTFDVKTRQSLNEEAEKHNITILEFTREIRLYRKVLGTDLSSMSLKELLAYAKELKDVEIKVKALYQKINKSQIQIPEAFSNHFSVISERYDSVYYEASQKLTQEIDEKKKVLHLQIKETRAKERKIKFKKIFKRFTLRLAFISLFLSALIVFLNLIVEGNFSGLPEFLANLMSSIQMNFSKFSTWISPVQIYVYFAFMLGLLLLMVLFLKGPYRKLLMFLLWVFALLDGIIYQTGLWVPGIVYSNTYPLTLIKIYGFDYLYMLFDREATIYAILSALMLFFVFRSIKYPKVKRFSYLMVRYSLLLIAVAMVLKVLYFELSKLSAIRLPMDVMVYYLYLSAYVMLGIGALFSFLFFLSKKKG